MVTEKFRAQLIIGIANPSSNLFFSNRSPEVEDDLDLIASSSRRVAPMLRSSAVLMLGLLAKSSALVLNTPALRTGLRLAPAAARCLSTMEEAAMAGTCKW